MDADTARAKGEANGAICNKHSMLLCLLLHLERAAHASFHRNGNNSGTRHTGGLRLDKPSMEGFNSLGGHRWRDRQRDSILVPFHVQSHMVAVPALLHGRTCWHKSHDIAAAHADGGVDGLHHGHHCCLPVSYLL